MVDPSRLQSAKAGLSKRSTFELAMKELQELISDSTVEDRQQLWEAVKRCFTLLKTRYTAQAFWIAGQALFTASLQADCFDKKQKAAAAGWLEECRHFLGEEDSSESGEQPRPTSTQQHDPFLFQGQLSEGEPPVRPSGLEDLLHRLAEQAQLRGPDNEPVDLTAEQQEEQQRQLEQALLASMGDEESQPTGPPPASKYAVRHLQKETLTEERLRQLGASDGVQCAVCREDLKVGEQVVIMPCHDNHVFHPEECLKPWLRQHNSCPCCRFELPTDDARYESRKEREAKEKEERKGAANALSHNEFLYT